MHEIKFRGKRLDGKGWAYGAYRPSEHSGKIYIAEHVGSIQEVDPETVGQYTGFDDVYQNGIYNGDELRFCYVIMGKCKYRRGVVRWFNDTSGWIAFLDNGEIMPLGIAVANAVDMDVYDNIFDNPTLKEVYRYDRI